MVVLDSSYLKRPPALSDVRRDVNKSWLPCVCPPSKQLNSIPGSAPVDVRAFYHCTMALIKLDWNVRRYCDHFPVDQSSLHLGCSTKHPTPPYCNKLELTGRDKGDRERLEICESQRELGDNREGPYSRMFIMTTGGLMELLHLLFGEW